MFEGRGLWQNILISLTIIPNLLPTIENRKPIRSSQCTRFILSSCSYKIICTQLFQCEFMHLCVQYSDSFDKAYIVFLHSEYIWFALYNFNATYYTLTALFMQHIKLVYTFCNIIYNIMHTVHCADALLSKDCFEEQFVNILFPWIDSQRFRFGLKSQRFHKSSKNAPYISKQRSFSWNTFKIKLPPLPELMIFWENFQAANIV